MFGKDALLHAGVAGVVCAGAVLATTPWWFMAGANALFWLGREIAQGWTWSWHKQSEWLGAAVVGAASAGIAGVWA